jgi:hypothetical protein
MDNADPQPSIRGAVVTAEELALLVPYVLAMHPNGHIIAAAVRSDVDDNSKECLGLYDANLKLLQLFKSEKTGSPTCVSYSSEGVLVVGNKDGNVQLWHLDPANKHIVCANIPCGSNVRDVAWNKDGTHLAVTSSSQKADKPLLTIIDSAKRTLLAQFDSAHASVLCYSPGPIEVLAMLNTSLTGKKYQSAMHEWAIERNKEKVGAFSAKSVAHFVAQDTRLTEACYSNDGSVLALAGANFTGNSLDHKRHAAIHFVNMMRERTYSFNVIPNTENERVVALAYAPRARRFVCCTNEGTLALYTKQGCLKHRAVCMKNGSCVQVIDCAIIGDAAESLVLALATARGLERVQVIIKPDQQAARDSESQNSGGLGQWVQKGFDTLADLFNQLA